MEVDKHNPNIIRSVSVRLITDKPVKKTPYQVKGVFFKHFPNNDVIPMLNGEYRKEYLYPRVQVKIINEQIYLVGINEGVDSILSLCKEIKELDFGNITFKVNDLDTEQQEDIMTLSNNPIKYQFVSPWVALNPSTNGRFKGLNRSGRIKYLSQLLTKNILFLGEEIGVNIDKKVFTWLSLSSLNPKSVCEKKWGSFSGSFKINFVLPNYIGLGNGITRGFGAIYRLDESGVLFLKNSANNNKREPKSILQKKKNTDNNIKTNKKKKYKFKKKKNNYLKNKHPQYFKDKPDTNSDQVSEETNYNRVKYHQKQHDF